jgi:hypothetical protein
MILAAGVKLQAAVTTTLATENLMEQNYRAECEEFPATRAVEQMLSQVAVEKH